MDVYHKVLVKLYDATGGRDSQAVDFKDLVKGLGFLGNYEDVTQNLSSQGWIAETTKANFVKITHWGVKEAQKSLSGDSGVDESAQLKKSANRLKEETKQFLILVEEFAGDVSKEKLALVEKKFGEINAAISKLKSDI
ncbi:MAG TPA: hypothetical protein PKE69_20440 [Pyrinomonadaceae bacterium]|nr:hypothetical protein [Pyrinomonadaceae bacterium]